MQDRLWICRDGRALLVSQMETSHIVNAIALIQRRPNWRRDYLPRLELELVIRSVLGKES